MRHVRGVPPGRSRLPRDGLARPPGHAGCHLPFFGKARGRFANRDARPFWQGRPRFVSSRRPSSRGRSKDGRSLPGCRPDTRLRAGGGCYPLQASSARKHPRAGHRALALELDELPGHLLPGRVRIDVDADEAAPAPDSGAAEERRQRAAGEHGSAERVVPARAEVLAQPEAPAPELALRRQRELPASARRRLVASDEPKPDRRLAGPHSRARTPTVSPAPPLATVPERIVCRIGIPPGCGGGVATTCRTPIVTCGLRRRPPPSGSAPQAGARRSDVAS